jgi:hypothetical protein
LSKAAGEFLAAIEAALRRRAVLADATLPAEPLSAARAGSYAGENEPEAQVGSLRRLFTGDGQSRVAFCRDRDASMEATGAGPEVRERREFSGPKGHFVLAMGMSALAGTPALPEVMLEGSLSAKADIGTD